MNSENEPNDLFEDEIQPSKSQLKRDALEVRSLAESLVEISPRKLSGLKLSDDVQSAINNCPPARTRGARKRHLQYISKLLRNTDNLEELTQQVNNPEESTTDNQRHETIRDKLVQSFTDHVDELRANYPSIDLQQARQLVRKAILERKADENNDASVPVEHSKPTSAQLLLHLLIHADKDH